MILPQEIPRHRQEREQRSITHKGKKTYDARDWRRPLLNRPWYKEKKKERKTRAARTHNSKCQEKSWSKKNQGRDYKEKTRGEETQARGGKKKNQNKTNKKTKAKVQERELTKRREVFGFSGGFVFFPWVCSKLRDREKAASTRTRKRTASRRITRQRINCGRGGAS